MCPLPCLPCPVDSPQLAEDVGTQNRCCNDNTCVSSCCFPFFQRKKHHHVHHDDIKTRTVSKKYFPPSDPDAKI